MNTHEKTLSVDVQDNSLSANPFREVDREDADQGMQALRTLEVENLQSDNQSDQRLLRKADLIIMPVSKGSVGPCVQ